MATLSSLSTSVGGGALRLLDRRIYTANGTWTKPADNAGNILAGVGKIVRIRVIGGGGGGVSGYESSYSVAIYAGGSGAGTSESTFDISQLTSTVTVTVGAGGTPTQSTTSFTAAGNAGGNSSFGSYVWAEGGSGGQCTFSAYPNTPPNLVAQYTAWDVVRAQYYAMGGTGSTAKGSRGAFLWFQYSSSTFAYTTTMVSAEKGPGCGGGAAGSLLGSASGSVAIGSNSTLGTPGPGGTNTTAGGLYGGGGGATNFGTAYAGGVGVVVVETWG